MVCRHFKLPFNFFCITDKDGGLLPNITVIKPTHNLTGWWNKLYMFSPLMPKGRLIYLDLDVVIVNDITGLISSYKGDYCGDEDHIHFGEGIFGNGRRHPEFGPIDCSLGTAVVSMRAGSHPEVWEKYLARKEEVERVFHRHGDQVFTSWALNGKFDLWERLYPDSHGIGSYRFDVLGNHPHGKKAPRPYSDFRIVNFHGQPKPAEVKEPWVIQARS